MPLQYNPQTKQKPAVRLPRGTVNKIAKKLDVSHSAVSQTISGRSKSARIWAEYVRELEAASASCAEKPMLTRSESATIGNLNRQRHRIHRLRLIAGLEASLLGLVLTGLVLYWLCQSAC